MTLQSQDAIDSAPLTDTPEPVSETPEPAASIADHASQFSPDRTESEPEDIPKTPANTGQFANKTDQRHRASTQRATPEDVQEINKLTKELREAEQRLADKDPDAKASPRIKTLRRQLAALRALETPAPAAPKAEPKPAAQTTATAFEDKEPEIEDFANDPDPYKAWTKATIKWEAKREKFEAAAAEAQQRYQQQEAQARERVETFATTKPDFNEVTSRIARQDIGKLLVHVCTFDDKGPEFVYHLAQHQDLLDALVFETHDKPITDTNVAVLQRRLTQALSQGQAVSTGSVAPARPYTPPKPPNPVRTGPIKTADEPPDQAGSIAEHRKHFGPK